MAGAVQLNLQTFCDRVQLPFATSQPQSLTQVCHRSAAWRSPEELFPAKPSKKPRGLQLALAAAGSTHVKLHLFCLTDSARMAYDV
eukprot:325937-Amphidinium_carterae.1